jgi:ABC-2 type transport system ATP-binding protein
MSEPAIAIHNFTRRFGKSFAVRDLSLTVPQGSIFGLLGRNGAGKTTTIRTLLNLLPPTSGRLEVLGLDSVRDSLRIRQRTGYLPERTQAYGWMTVDELLRFNGAFYPAWDAALAAKLVRELALPGSRRMAALSRGMQAKLGLVLALAARPELLILDDPTSGLDPVVRAEFLEAMIANVQAEGGTVFFSSHLLHELERIVDEVAILHEGRLLLQATPDALKERYKKLRVVYPLEVPERFPVEGLVRHQRNGHQAVLTVSRFDSAQLAALRAGGAETVEVIDLSLEEIFVENLKGGSV